jgi:hypothetical protein
VLAIHFATKGPAADDRLRILKHFPKDRFDIRPIVDPKIDEVPMIGGSPTLGEAAAQASRVSYFGSGGGTPAIDATDVGALEQLDVIIAPREWAIRDEVAEAIHTAVSNGGVGLLEQTPLGLESPGTRNSTVLALSGFSEGNYFYFATSSGDVSCVVVGADHPLLAGLPARQFTMRGMNGVIGTLAGTGTPLIAAPNCTNQRGDRSSGAVDRGDELFYPLYVAQLGRGRIVGCQWYAPDPPPALAKVPGEDFYVRCVRWLAHMDGGR